MSATEWFIIVCLFGGTCGAVGRVEKKIDHLNESVAYCLIGNRSQK